MSFNSTYMSMLVLGLLSVIMLLAANPAAAQSVSLGTCANFAVLAGTSVSANGVQTTISSGSVGVAPGTSITGNLVLNSGSVNNDNTAAINCAADNLKAYGQAKGATCTTTIGSELGGTTITPGVYCTASGTFTVSAGTVTLDGQGNSNAIWIFQAATTVNTATATSFVLQNGAQAANVFWQAGTSVTLGASSSFVGTVLAYASISFGSSTTLTGRALAQAGVTFAGGDSIVLAADSQSSSSSSSSGSSTSTTSQQSGASAVHQQPIVAAIAFVSGAILLSRRFIQ